MIKNHEKPSQPLTLTELAGLALSSIGHALRLLFHPTTFQQWRRIFREGRDPVDHLLIQANNTAIINRLLKDGTKVVFISSFFRSGNTWIRYMLSDLFLQMQDVETETRLPLHPDDLIPHFRFNCMGQRLLRFTQWFKNSPVVFVKTHSLFSRVEQIIGANGPAKGDCRALYVYRAPEDALVSFYHFCLHQPGWETRPTVGIDEFCLQQLPDWMASVSSYLNAAAEGFPTFLVSYESLSAHPGEVMRDLLDWIGLPCEEEMLERATTHMQFDKLQRMEVQDNPAQKADKQKLFFRRGQPGAGRLELKDATLQEIRRRTAALVQQAEELRLAQGKIVPVSQLQEANRPAYAERSDEARRSAAAASECST
jgi:hypothetical protein